MLFSFCSVSDFNKHGPSAIWAHLKPIYNKCTKRFQALKQSICKRRPNHAIPLQTKVLLIFNRLLENFHFKSGSWNFLEAGHWKGPADGIGGAIERVVDAFIANGGIITNAKSLMSAISWKTKVEMFEIQESEITIIERVTPSNLSAVPGTMKLHQICQSEHLKYSI